MKSLFRVIFYTSLLYYVLVVKTIFIFDYKKVDVELMPYIDEYKNLLTKFCPSGNYNKSEYYSIYFVNEMEEDNIGICYKKINGYTIEINKKWWKDTDFQSHRQLIYHEMAHCLIDKLHVNEPNNYMNPYFYILPDDLLQDQVALDIYNRCH